ncbi:DUF2189 domain-containing protein [Thiosulfativibrio zosterae]|uniref:Cytochrome b6 n=1 Tax=Thiosulfativibrio zosterae TaxID=2675053 RepID=A0A6F8PPT0_9GAMM|nr:DUF2189 domain-containing protein [Thiosulfativibrio zosterae]BBP44131.1 cytochrome b6 [Thiosulfativibrio zosterae]
MSTTVSTSHTHLHLTESGEHLVSHDAKYSDIGRWLRQGWMDMAHAPGASLFYGSIMALSVALVYFSFIAEPLMMFKVATFFVLLSPFLATGLYYVAQQLEQGKQPSLSASLVAWRPNVGEFALFAVALGLVIAIWARITPMIAAVVKSNSLLIVDPNAGLMGFLSSDAGLSFLAYFMIGAVIATAFVFTISVVTIPLLLRDNNIGAVQAMIISFQVTMENKGVMAVWALTVGALVTLGLVTFGLAMLIVMPLLGYASWHAFNDLVEIKES